MVLLPETDRLGQEPKETLAHGCSLIIAAERAIVGAVGEKEDSKDNPSGEIQRKLLEEYRAIEKAFFETVGWGKIIVIGENNIPALDLHYHSWPRNAHTIIGGQVYVVPDAWKVQDSRVIKTEFGNGGAVLTKGNAVVAANVAIYDIEEEVEALRERGIRVGVIPPVSPLSQKCAFAYDDIDCHVALVENRDSELNLFVAKSYFDQDVRTGEEIRRAAEEIESRLTVIEDAGLPPFSFNLVQFSDLSVVMTSGAPVLEESIMELVGEEKVHTTDVPIVEIPKRKMGGISCMTNITPDFLIKSPSID